MNNKELLEKYLMVDDINDNKKELFELIPELIPEDGFDQMSVWHCYDVWQHTVHAVNNCDLSFIDRVIMLLHDIGKPFCYQTDGDVRHFKGHAHKSKKMAKKILERFELSKDEKKEILLLIDKHADYIDLKRVNIKNKDFYIHLIKIQKCDGSAYEKEHGKKFIEELNIKLEKINSKFNNM